MSQFAGTAITIIFAILLCGCATKQYGTMPSLSRGEVTAFNCRDIAVETAKVRGFIDSVHQQSKFDGKQVLALLGDFGIGNAMSKQAALESADQRMRDLQNAASLKDCDKSSTELGV